MKRIITLLSSLVFLAFTACGGGDDSGGAPPPPLNSPLNPGSVQIKDDMLNQINALKGGACEQEGKDVMFVLIAAQATGGPAGVNGLPPLQDRTNSAGCDNLLNNIIWNSTHILYANGQPWINDPAAKFYMAQRIGAFLNRIQGQVQPAASAAGIPPDQLLATFQNQLIPYFQSRVRRLSSQAPELAGIASPYLGGTGI